MSFRLDAGRRLSSTVLLGLMLGAQLRKLPGFVRADRAVAVDDAHPSSGILASGVKIHSRKAERFAVGHSGGNDLHQGIADTI